MKLIIEEKNKSVSKRKGSIKLKNDKNPLALEFPLLADHYTAEMKDDALAFNDEYKRFLDLAKTERETVKVVIEAAEELGFVPLREQTTLKAGMKVYHSIKGKGLVLALIGEKSPDEGLRVLGAHIDSPRLDLKPQPLYEDKELVYFKTHYYGGIKKYQWASIPLALHGLALRADGSPVELCLGEAEGDPQFVISDLLPHLDAKQMEKKGKEILTGEDLNLLIAATPQPGEGKNRFKAQMLQYLFERYGLVERDLISAELCAVPAAKAVDIGFDRLLLGAYGQDDRVCAYPAIQALFNCNQLEHTGVVLLTDKEEIGSDGNTGAESRLYENILAELYQKSRGAYDEPSFRLALEKSAMLSSDVTNAFDPNFASVSDEKNSSYLGHGLSVSKYTGHGGKYEASDANAEFISAVMRLFDRCDISWQSGELGKIDEGGGGTIAKCFANLGLDVLDCGVPLLSMHSPFEISHKFDVYESYRAYRCFLEQF